ncbi:MAG: DUF58 domain-containing protein [Deltaproteobacteria bacterium]|nr:DUF58 domain-containing protein [Deltaproteobacteria bacterium]MBW2050731.1 DUF58 domain-containing protein [Deltaproteobacteria bacterium]MBW2140873.1 DUF58 domain-containing protein [Deltaproteobacteria bacterium]MBW2322985.1 DUF58 domain-containing protein [Deltaproteobacteria bacterium]
MSGDSDVESFLDEDFLKKLERLKILAQQGIKGPTKGEHRSWRSGASLEFLDYRKYQVGDDFRYIDWNVYGRLDKLFVKLFRSEEDLNIHILLDMSRSMGMGTPPKEIYAKKVAAALSYIGLANLDRVGVTAFNSSLGDSKPPGKGKQVYLSVLKYLLSLNPEGGTNFNSCLSEYATTCKRPGIAVILSDLLDPQGVQKGLDALRYRKFDITLVQILDSEELFPSYSGYLTLREVETNESKKITLNQEILTLFRQKMDGFLKDIKEFCYNSGIDYYLSDTSIPFEDFLLDYLTKGTIFH